MRLFLRKSRVRRGCSVSTRSENAVSQRPDALPPFFQRTQRPFSNVTAISSTNYPRTLQELQQAKDLVIGSKARKEFPPSGLAA